MFDKENVIAESVTRILGALGYSCIGGLTETPRRVARYLIEATTPPSINWKTFFEKGADEMVVVDNIPFNSLCEHHMLPFFGKGLIAYLPRDGHVVGLSKLPRVLTYYATGLNTQERITTKVADFLMKELSPLGCGVILQAEHTCMTLRGIKAHGSKTTTVAIRGQFQHGTTRHEFLSLADRLKLPS